MILTLLFLLTLAPPPDSTEILRESVVTAFRQPDKVTVGTDDSLRAVMGIEPFLLGC